MYYDTAYDPPYPAVRIRITVIEWGEVIEVPLFNALIDTGADRTCIPTSIIPTQLMKSYSWYRVVGGGKDKKQRCLVLSDAKVEFIDQSGNSLLEKTHPELILVPYEEGLLGRDILNTHFCSFHGPEQQCTITNP
jgi:hypothetical protein